MPAEVMTTAVALVFVTIAAIAARWRHAKQSELTLQLQQAGTLTTGQVVAINRPFGAARESQVYFSYEIPGSGTFVQSCSIDMRALREEHAVFMPSVGSQVTVRYLPKSPQHAILPQLEPCLIGFAPARFRT